MSFTSQVIATSALMILLGIGALSFRSTLRDEQDRQWVTHTHLVIEKLQAVRIDITEAEAGQWGYLLTGRESHLKPYEAGLKQLRQDMEDVQELTVDNPRQQESVQRLQGLVAARLVELAEGIEVRNKSGLVAGVEAVAFENVGGKWIGKIGTQIDEMRRREGQLLAGRQERAATSSRKMKAVIVVGNAVAILILLVAGFVIHRETGRRSLAEQYLKHVNERLELQAGELSDTNNELESFTYSVAHDLRAPLRHMAGYSNVVLQDYGPKLDGEARRQLEKISDGAEKMGQLVDDLLSLSKVGLQELALEDTALNSLVRRVVRNLAPECSGREIEWKIGDLSHAECDSGLMEQVFVNLLSNAVKYTGKQERAVIEVGERMQGGERVIFIRDNGVGFEMQYAGKLFGVFQRLHKTRDFEGTGVGLAIVQRIIRKHGGRIWAEAELDQGATFSFTVGSPGKQTSNQPEIAVENAVENGVTHAAQS